MMNGIRVLPLSMLPISHVLLSMNVLPINHLLLPINVLLISHLLLPLNVLPISNLLLLLLDVLLISHPLLLLQLLYPKTPRNGSKGRWSKTKRKRKRLMLHPTRTTQKRKRAVSHKTKTKQRRKKPMRPWNGNVKIMKSLCTLEEEALINLDHGSTHSDIFQTVTGMNELLEIIVTETHRYAIQRGRNFETTEDEMKAFLWINFIIGIKKLTFLDDYWSTDKYIGNEKIQNVITRTRF